MPAPVAASLTIDPSGANNSMDYTAKTKGSLGNGITIEYKAGGTAGSETISGSQLVITCNMQDGVSTAAQIKTAIDGDSRAASLVTVANHAGNDGSGTCAATAATPLAGGLDGAPNSDVNLITRQNRSLAAEILLSGYDDADIATVLTAARAAGFKDDAALTNARMGGIIQGINS